MLLPSTRRLALLSLTTFLILLFIVRHSQYQDYPSHQHLPVPDGDRSEQWQTTPKPERPPVNFEEEFSNNSPLEAEEQPDAGTATPEHSGPTDWYAPSDGQSSTAAQDGVDNTPLPQVKNVKQYLQEVLDWNRPNQEDGHWPDYKHYIGRDYDPNRWEEFPMEDGFYTKSGIHLLDQSTSTSAKPYMPYPDYNSDSWRQQWSGDYQYCEGPRGLPLNESSRDLIRAYRGPTAEFPKPSAGSFEAVGMDGNVCFDRYSRYRPYGFGEETTDVSGLAAPEKVAWEEINWGKLQDQCLERNKDRYAPHARSAPNMDPDMSQPKGGSTLDILKEFAKWKETRTAASPSYRSRTAILIRSWEGYTYTENDIQAIRALIVELSLLSGGEYQVFLFVNVKNEDAHIYSSKEAYDVMLKRSVPAELRSVTILWSEEMCKKWYPEVTDWQVYWHQWMPVQWFSETHPEFDFVWNWETDARYTGHHYHLFEALASFACKQPRKYLWERNKRYYLPAVHGSYAQFVASTNDIIADASASGQIKPVWGPQPYLPAQTPLGPSPPTTEDADNFAWGVSEEADLITLLPIWDPRNTSWSYKDKIWNFVPDDLTGRMRHPIFNPSQPADEGFTDPRFADLPRRVFINTVARFSRKLLHAMHVENAAGRTMQAEMWPATVALHHGLKPVFAPHPTWFDRQWPAAYADLIFNAAGGTSASPAPERSSPSDPDPNLSEGRDWPAQWGERQDSPYNHDREFNFWGWSWYYRSRFPGRLYRRWLGWKTVEHPFGYLPIVAGGAIEEAKNGGRMCLPAMLVHPVKEVKEGEVWDDRVVH